jgi:hypothetical protein
MGRRGVGTGIVVLWVVLLLLVMALIAAIFGNKVSHGSQPGSLTVNIIELPSTARANVTIKGPHSKTWQLQGPKTLTGLETGRYTIIAHPVEEAPYRYDAVDPRQVRVVPGNGKPVEVNYFDETAISVRGLQVRTCGNGPIALNGTSLVFRSADVTKAEPLNPGTVVVVPPCGRRMGNIVAEVTGVDYAFGVVVASTILVVPGPAGGLAALIPRGEINSNVPLRIPGNAQSHKKSPLLLNFDKRYVLNACDGVINGTASLRAGLTLHVHALWGGPGAILTNALHGYLPLPFTSFSLTAHMTQSAALHVSAPGYGPATCSAPVRLPELDLEPVAILVGEFPVEVHPKIEFEGSVTVAGTLKGSMQAAENFSGSATNSLASPEPHVTFKRPSFSSGTKAFMSVQTLKVELNPQVVFDIDESPVGISTGVGLGFQADISRGARAWSLTGWLGVGNIGVDIGTYQSESQFAWRHSWSVFTTDLTPQKSPRAPVAALCDVDGRGSSSAHFLGSLGGGRSMEPVVGIACLPNERGYWLVSAKGYVAAYGKATVFPHLRTHYANVVGIAPSAGGKGYWLAAANGEVIPFGQAATYASITGLRLNAPIIGITATSDGQGYWLVASDGGVFAFGDAVFEGSTGSMKLNKPVVGMAPSLGTGYWLVAGDGGVFAFGVPFAGSAGSLHLPVPVAGMISMPGKGGYWLVLDDGGTMAFPLKPGGGSPLASR